MDENKWVKNREDHLKLEKGYMDKRKRDEKQKKGERKH